MLSAEDNDLLTRVGPGTEMGTLLREYWQPVLLSSELPAADGDPLRVRLLGEDLVAFRDSGGNVGLLADHCAHRGASLFFGRNEECGLRCVYHGWKYDVHGTCVDMPNEPPDSNFKDKVRQPAYPCRELGGVIWAYLGQRAEPPGLPELAWASVPAEQRYLTKRHLAANWAQGLEGDIDSSHVGFLHSQLKAPGDLKADEFQTSGLDSDYARGWVYKTRDRHPRFEMVTSPCGLMIAARRNAEVDSYYWRITQYILPYHSMIPQDGDNAIHCNAYVPMDDTNTMILSIEFHPSRALTEDELAGLRSGLFSHAGVDDFLPANGQPGSAWKAKANRDNDYLIDRQAQRTTHFSGVRGIWAQDRSMTEGMGPIFDRGGEHLGTSDAAVIQMRRLLLNTARGLREHGTVPPGVDPRSQRVSSAAVVLPRDADWTEAAKTELFAHPLGAAL